MQRREIEDIDNTGITEYEIPRSTKDFLAKMAKMAFPGNSAIERLFRIILLAYGTLHFSMIMYYTKRFGWRLVGTQWSEYRKTITKVSLEIFKKTIEEMMEADYDIGALNCIFLRKEDRDGLYKNIVGKIEKHIDNAVIQIEEHVYSSFEDNDNRSVKEDVLLRIKAQQAQQLKALRNLAISVKEIIEKQLEIKQKPQPPGDKFLSLPAPNPCTDGNKIGCKKSKEYIDQTFKTIKNGYENIFEVARDSLGSLTGGRKQCLKILDDEATLRLKPLGSLGFKLIDESTKFVEKLEMKGKHDMENADYHRVHFNSFLMVIVFFQFMRILYNSLFKKKKKALTDDLNGEITTYNFIHKKSMKSRLNKLNKKQLETLCKKMKKHVKKHTKSGMVKSLLQPLC